MSEMLELAARVEAATGADREIDRDIALALGAYDQPEDLGCFKDPAEAVVDGGGQTWAPPAYTASLDAAMGLVPEGVEGVPLSFKLERFYLGSGVAKCRSAVWDGLGRVSSLDTATDAATPALALCAAALRARAAA